MLTSRYYCNRYSNYSTTYNSKLLKSKSQEFGSHPVFSWCHSQSRSALDAADVVVTDREVYLTMPPPPPPPFMIISGGIVALNGRREKGEGTQWKCNGSSTWRQVGIAA